MKTEHGSSVFYMGIQLYDSESVNMKYTVLPARGC